MDKRVLQHRKLCFRGLCGKSNEKSFQSKADAVFKKSHRWRYSYTKKSLRDQNSKRFIESIDQRLYAFGDWCEGPSMQDAWLSGKKLAQHFSEIRLKN